MKRRWVLLWEVESAVLKEWPHINNVQYSRFVCVCVCVHYQNIWAFVSFPC